MALPLPDQLISNLSDCIDTSDLVVGENERILRVSFPTLPDTSSPIGKNWQLGYTPSLEFQISSWLPGRLRTNYMKRNCNIVVVSQVESLYLLANYGNIFSVYVP